MEREISVKQVQTPSVLSPSSGMWRKEGTDEPRQGGRSSAFTPTGNEPWRFRKSTPPPTPMPQGSLGISHTKEYSLLQGYVKVET